MDDEALRRLLDQTERHGGLAAWAWDPRDPGRYPWSLGMQRLLDLPPPDGRNDVEQFFARIHPEDRDRIRAAYDGVEREGSIPEASFRSLHRDGTVVHLRSSGVLLQRGDGTRVFLGTLLDVTERVSLEAKLVEAERSRAAAQLAAGVAHDLGNWLTVVRHVADRLGEQHPVRVELERALAPCFSLTRELLALAQERPAVNRRVEIGGLVKALGPALRALLGPTIQVELASPERVWVSIDPTHLEGVLLNLATNARDAMPGGGTLLISVRAEGDRAVLTVADDGSGISPERMPRVFEPYFTTKPIGHGSGLGLASVRGTIRQHGGDVTVEARPGGGTCFTIELPARSAPRVLVVDDLPDVRGVLCELLTRAGMVVTEAGDGAEALARIEAQEPDLVLTDLVMPGMDGEALVDALTQRGGPPFVVVSGYGSPRIGRAPVVRKPFRPAEVLEAVSRALR